jgi:Fe-Mn family superoxide dismutase
VSAAESFTSLPGLGMRGENAMTYDNAMTYIAQAPLKPRALRGISDDQIDQHWVLYEGYVKNTSLLIEELAKAEIGSRHWSELKRRLGFEWNGMVLHEYYFGNMAAGSKLNAQSALAETLRDVWGSVEGWRDDFAKTAGIRGIGWAILYHDTRTNHLYDWWVTEHEMNHPVGLDPILVLDVFEHAWMVDYGASEKDAYVGAFLDNVNWEVVEHRFKDSTLRNGGLQVSASPAKRDRDRRISDRTAR